MYKIAAMISPFARLPFTWANHRSHRSTKIDADVRWQKLRAFIEPVQAAWQDTKLTSAMSSFSGFCELLALDKVSDYLISRQVHRIQDWGSHTLDAEGQAIQRELDERLKVLLTALSYPTYLHRLGTTTSSYQNLLQFYYREDRKRGSSTSVELCFVA